MDALSVLDGLKNVFNFFNGGASASQPEATPGGLTGFISNNDDKLSLASAFLLSRLDGDDSTISEIFTGMIDYFMLKQIASGEDSTLAQGWMAYRMASVAGEQLEGQNALVRWGGMAAAFAMSWMGITKFENAAAAPTAPALS